MDVFHFNPNDLHRLNRLMFSSPAAATDESSGGHRTRRSGEGSDFLDYRPYVAGDDLRRVDWTLYGRLRQLFVRLYEAPRQISVTLLLDASRSMGFGQPVSKLLQAQRIVCGMGFVALRGGDRLFAGSFGGNSTPLIGPLGGRRGLPALVRFLQKTSAGGRSDLGGAVRQLQARGRRRGLVVVISDFLNIADYELALGTLLGGGAKIMVIQVLDPLDRGVGLSGVVRLTDSETGRRVDVRVDSSNLARYQARFQERREQLESFCTRRGQYYKCVHTGDSYLEAVCEALRSRAMGG
jgi:uncharacterized protein (DUF58 family)